MGVPAVSARAGRGFTLIETVIAIAAVTLAIVPAAGMWQAAGEAAAATEESARALAVAQAVLETRVRGVDYAHLAAGGGADAASGLAWTLTLTPVMGGLQRAEVVVVRGTDPTPVARLYVLTGEEQ